MRRPNTRFKRGMVAGLLAAAVVAVWFFVLDAVAGHPLQTPAALGSSLLFAQTTVEWSARTIVGYFVFHFVAFILGGVLFVWVAERLERRPSFILFALLFVILGEALVLAILASYAQWGLGSLGVWSLTIANILAMVVMGWYIWATHPTLRHVSEDPPPALRV
jgi:MFS family permease